MATKEDVRILENELFNFYEAYAHPLANIQQLSCESIKMIYHGNAANTYNCDLNNGPITQPMYDEGVQQVNNDINGVFVYGDVIADTIPNTGLDIPPYTTWGGRSHSKENFEHNTQINLNYFLNLYSISKTPPFYMAGQTNGQPEVRKFSSTAADGQKLTATLYPTGVGPLNGSAITMTPPMTIDTQALVPLCGSQQTLSVLLSEDMFNFKENLEEMRDTLPLLCGKVANQDTKYTQYQRAQVYNFILVTVLTNRPLLMNNNLWTSIMYRGTLAHDKIYFTIQLFETVFRKWGIDLGINGEVDQHGMKISSTSILEKALLVHDAMAEYLAHEEVNDGRLRGNDVFNTFYEALFANGDQAGGDGDDDGNCDDGGSGGGSGSSGGRRGRGSSRTKICIGGRLLPSCGPKEDEEEEEEEEEGGEYSGSMYPGGNNRKALCKFVVNYRKGEAALLELFNALTRQQTILAVPEHFLKTGLRGSATASRRNGYITGTITNATPTIN